MSEQRRKRKEERESPPPKHQVLRKILVALAIVLVIFGIYYAIYYKKSHRYDAFAKCLSDKKAKMYGLYWCPHCADQKEMFGESFHYVTYVECGLPGRSGEQQSCKDAGVKLFPTWEFPDGERDERVLSFEYLSQKTGCTLP